MGEASEDSTLRTNTLKTKPAISFEVKEGQAEKKESKKTVPFYKLFRFADSLDKVLMTVGTIAAIGNGLTQPLMSLIFGELIDIFGKTQSHNTVSLVSKVSLKFVYLALGCGAAAFLQVTCWMVTGERQSARVRGLYLKTILQQEVAYFDQKLVLEKLLEECPTTLFSFKMPLGKK